MARSTRLVILIKNIYTLWGRKRFLLPVTYFPTNLVYPFTLRVTGIKSHHKKSPRKTGLIIITFDTLTLPDSLNVGYIPLPLGCKNCLRFGHPTPTCKSPEELCKNYSEKVHTEENEKCNNEKSYINCKNISEIDSKHSPLDRSCPTSINQK